MVGSNLYDAGGHEFRIRGINKLHWDNQSTGLANSNANTRRSRSGWRRRPDLAKYAQAVFQADPEKNVIFDRHVYGGDADVTALNADADALAALGLPIIFGEFGPGRDIGPSPTNLTPAQVIQTAEQHNFGWMAWAWDDNDQANAQADNAWFALSYSGAYATSSDLTIFGQQIVEGCTNPAPGGCGCPDSPVPAMTAIAPGCQGTPAPVTSSFSLKALAVPATIF